MAVDGKRHTQQQSPPRRTQVQRRTEARTKLLLAAAELIGERGLAGLTLSQVGERAGFSRGITNHHFGSKAALVTELVDQVQQEFAEATAPVFHLDSPIDAIIESCRIFLEMLADLPPIHRAFLVLWADAVATSPELRPVMDASDRAFREAIVYIAQSGIAEGSITTEIDLAAFAAGLLGQLRGVALQHLLAPGAIDLVQVRDEMARSMRRSLARDSRSTRPTPG